MYSRLSSQTWIISLRWIIEKLYLSWDLNSPKLQGDLNQAPQWSMWWLLGLVGTAPNKPKARIHSGKNTIFSPRDDKTRNLYFSLRGDKFCYFWPHLSPGRDELVTLTNSRPRTRYACDFNLISPPNEMGLLLWPTLAPGRDTLVISTSSCPRTRWACYFDLISPPDEMSLLLFAFNPCLEDGLRTFPIQLAIPCIPLARIFVLQTRFFCQDVRFEYFCFLITKINQKRT